MTKHGAQPSSKPSKVTLAPKAPPSRTVTVPSQRGVEKQSGGNMPHSYAKTISNDTPRRKPGASWEE